MKLSHRTIFTGSLVLAATVFANNRSIIAHPREPAKAYVQDVQSETPMSLSGFSPSQAYEIEDTPELDINNPFLVQLLHNVESTSLKTTHHYSKYSKNVSINDIKEYPRKHRLWMFKVNGRVKKVVKHRYPDAGKDDALRGCFIVDMQTDQSESVKVVARRVPNAWRLNEAVDYRGSFLGFFLQHLTSETANDSAGLSPVFVSRSLGWFPDRADAQNRIGTSQMLLAEHGVDIGQYDNVRKRNTRSLGRSDTEAFYQMLRATNKVNQIPRNEALGFFDLMKNPNRQFAKSVSLTARCRRCVPIEITDQDIQTRYGLKRYFELDMFMPIDGKIVVNNADGGDALTYENRFPITVCVARLPTGMAADEVSGNKVEINGFFFRFWRYQSEFTDQADGASGQVSPLIIGLPPTIIESSTRLMDIVLVTVLLVTILGIVGMIWWYRKSDRDHAEKMDRKKQSSTPEKIDFGGLHDNLED